MAVIEVAQCELPPAVPVAPVEVPRESPAGVYTGLLACGPSVQISFQREEESLGVREELRGTEETGMVPSGSNHSVTAITKNIAYFVILYS